MSETTSAAPDDGQIAAPATAEPVAASAPPDGQEQTGARTEGEGEPEGGKPATPRGVQKRLDEMRRQIGDTQRLNERLVGVLEKSLQAGKPPSLEQRPAGPPRREEFRDAESYLEAKADYVVSQKFAEIERRTEERKAQEAVAAVERAFSERMQKAAEKYDDFEEVAYSDKHPVTDVMADAMRESEIGPEIAYFLGKNPAEARRIATLSGVAQAVEIGKIETRLAEKSAAPPVKREPSKAPAPITPVGKGKATASESLEDLSMEEYARRRNARGRR